MLPDVDPEQRDVALHDRRVLVRGRVDREARAVPDEPGPAAPEALHASVVDRSAQVVEGAERVLDRRAQHSAGLAASVRAHDLPEHGVVGVAAGVVPDGGLLVLGEGVEVREHALDRCIRELRPLERGVRVRHVRPVVDVVVDSHRLRVDMRFERVVGVR